MLMMVQPLLLLAVNNAIANINTLLCVDGVMMALVLCERRNVIKTFVRTMPKRKDMFGKQYCFDIGDICILLSLITHVATNETDQ